jgi:cysteine desulfurase / selenocysteine lyase
MFEKARDKVAQFINAKNSAEIVFVRSTTEAINLLAYSWGLSNLSKDDEVLVSLMEHHSNIVPWEITSKIKGFTIRYAEINNDGTLDYNDLERKISEKTKIVCLSHVSNVTGVINDIKQVTKTAHENNALILVDGAQSVPHLKVDVQDLGVDFLAFSGHKMLGPTGVGILYGKKGLLEGMVPFQGGGEMIKEVEFPPGKDHCTLSWNEVPWKFEAGTPNIAGAIGLMEAIKYLERLGMDNVLSHEKALTKYAVERLSECQKIILHGSSDLSMKCGIIPFSMEGLSSHDIALLCDNYGIMIRSGFHCAQPLHQVFKLQSSARASFYVYNTNAEIDKFVEVLKEVQQL